jgi:2Fe-2S ferredoxin
MISIKVTDLDGQQHDVKANEGESLMEALRHDEWGVAAICGGMCSCGTCHVYIDTDWYDKFQQPDSDELDLLDVFDTTKDNSRLSCQLFIQAAHEGLELSIAAED